jgi:hypothetical protein
MSAAPARFLLHVGAPHCGSVALQTALSATPSLPTQDGQELRYTALSPQSGGWTVLSGRSLRMAAERSIKGCTATTAPAETDSAPFFAALDRVRRKAGRTVPVLSHPGWIGQADSFATALPHWFEGETETPVDICAFARPPLDWLNAAYWRWGIWSGRGFGSWLERLGTPYTLGAALTRWAALRGARVTLRLDADVLSGFDAACGTTLPRPARRPTPLPPALLGFLMRNRRYRPDADDTATETVFQRWCHVPDAPRLWAVLPRHLRPVRVAAQSDLDLLFALLPAEQAEAVRAAPSGWTSDAPYEALLRRGRASLEDSEELAQLYRALGRGVGLAAEAAGKPVPQLQPVMSTRTSVHAWDVAVAQALEHLIALDTDVRRRRRPFGL